MFNLTEYRKNNTRLADYLPWAALVAPGIVLNKDGSFQRVARFRGADLDSSVPAELMAVAARLNNAFRRLGSGWAVFVEAQRREAATYPDDVFPDAASALVDLERKAAFEEEGAHYESSYFLTFLYLPPSEEAARMQGWFYEGQTKGGLDPKDVLAGFKDRTDRVLALLQGFMPECAFLDDEETLTYLHSSVSTKYHKVRVPEVPMYLDGLLADQPLTGGLAPILGTSHLRVLTITGFPGQTTPGILDDLNRLAFPYRWSTRAILMDKVDAAKVLVKARRQWFAKRKSIGALIKEVMTNETSSLMDSDAANKAADADEALQELGADYVGEAYVTVTVTVWDEDGALADEKLRLVEKAIQGRDFTCHIETINAVDAWLGSLPGHAYANVRQPILSTLNLAHMIPLSAVWAGEAKDEQFNAAPLFYARAEGATPFRFVLHVGDVGHTLVVGPTGAGKSVLLSMMALQFRRYANNQIFAFDFGGSIRAATLSMGGDWHDLGGIADDGGGNTVTLQPLIGIDDIAERTWAAGWLADILMQENITITPDIKDHIWTALSSLGSSPPEQRTLTGFVALLQNNDLKQALQPYCLGGAHGRLLDGDTENIGGERFLKSGHRFSDKKRANKNNIQAFETEGLIGTSAAPIVLSYLFHRIEHQLDGRPTMLIIDEGWLALGNTGFAGQLREWLKTLRKKNASVIFATQSLSDIDASAIAPAIIESCPTRLLLPNDRAVEPQISDIYRCFGLNDRQIEILAQAIPKRDYYCQSRRGNRLFELGLSEIALALCAASSKDDQKAIGEIVSAHPSDGFLPAWLDHKGLDWAIDLIPDISVMAEGTPS